MPNLRLVAGFCSALCVAACAQASSLGPLGDASSFNVFAFNNVSSSSDIGGQVAIGGSLLGSLTLGNQLNSGNPNYSIYPNSFTLVAANGLNNNHVTQNSGGNDYAPGATAGGSGANTIQIQNVQQGQGSTVYGSGNDPITFGSDQTALTSLSSTIAGTQSSLTLSGTQINPTNTGGTDIYHITAAQFATLTNINTNGNTIIVDVSGSSVASPNSVITINGQQTFGDNTAGSKVLFNFSQATSVSLNSGFNGSILAPLATLTGSNQYDGTAVVNNLNFTGEIHTDDFTGNVPDGTNAPEPSYTWLLGAGLPLIGFVAMRRRG